MSTGDRMKARRKALHISAEVIAESLGVSPATVYRYEKGEIEKVPSSILNPLSEVLQTTPQYLMGWTDDPTPSRNPQKLNIYVNDKELKLLEAFRSADPVFQDEAIDMLKRHPKK